MSHASSTCPNCGAPMRSNGGVEKGTTGHAAHFGTHGMVHRDPVMIGVSLLAAGFRAIHPEKFICTNARCGYSYKA